MYVDNLWRNSFSLYPGREIVGSSLSKYIVSPAKFSRFFMCWCLLYSNCNWDTHCIIVLSVFRPFCGSGFVFERTRKQKKNKEPFWRGEEKHLQPKDITVRIRLRPFKQSPSAGSRAEFLLLFFFFSKDNYKRRYSRYIRFDGNSRLDCKYQPFIICCNCTMTKTEILFKQKKVDARFFCHLHFHRFSILSKLNAFKRWRPFLQHSDM